MKNTNTPSDTRTHREELSEQVHKKEIRRIKGRREKRHGMYFGLGMFGLVGWSVAIPTFLGLALGIWIDNTWPSRFSWTLMGLLGGIILGCYNAWYWVSRESRLNNQDEEVEDNNADE